MLITKTLAAGKQPYDFLRSMRTVSKVNLLAEQLQLPRDQIVPTFVSGPFRGTWVHRDLAVNLAMYCDDSGALELAVSQAIRALADRPPVMAPDVHPDPSYQAKASGILTVVAAKKQDLAVEQQLLAATERGYRAKEKHVAEMGSSKAISIERQQAAKRKAQAAADTQKLERFKKLAASHAAATAKRDKQDHLRAIASRMPDFWGRGTSAIGPSGIRPSSSSNATAAASSSGTFALADAVKKAAVQLTIPEYDVTRFMATKQSGYSMWQKINRDVKLVKKGSTVTQSARFGYNGPAVYCASKLNAAVAWIKKNYKTVS